MKTSFLGPLVLVAACASGGGGTDPKLDAGPRDAPNNLVDSSLVDARLDAGVDAMVDAATVDAGPFCSNNNQCTVSGECCVRLGGPTGFCAPGTPFQGDCIPDL